MLTNNSLRVVAINSVGDFVLFLGKVFVVLATVLIGTKMFEVGSFSFLLLYFCIIFVFYSSFNKFDHILHRDNHVVNFSDVCLK